MPLVIMKSTLTHLKRVCLWPKTENSSANIIYVTLISGSLFMVGSMMRVTVVSIEKKDTPITDSIENIISQIGAMYFAVFFVINLKQVRNIMGELSDFEKFGKPSHFDKRNKELDNMATLFRIILHTSVSITCSWPAIYTKDCKKSGEEVCGLVSPVWLPFDFSHFPVKHIVYIYQCYCCLVAYGSAGTYSMAMLETMEHLVIKIEHLKMLIFEVIEEKDPETRQKLFQRWVDYHVHVLNIGKDMNKNYRVALSTHVLCAGALFGFMGHALIENPFSNFNSLSLFIGWFVSLFVVCVGGQHLIDESLSVGEAIYNTAWYNLDVSFQKNLLPVMIRSEKSILIFAGPFTYLSHLLILAVLRTAYTYINLLNATS